MYKDAINYHKKGWRVVPLVPKKKYPFIKNWTEKDLNRKGISYYFKEKNCNVGIRTGKASGIVILDFDSDPALRRYMRQCPEVFDASSGVPKTLSVRRELAPEWRYHLYFQVKDDTDFPKNIRSAGWDLLSNNKQAVAPPSIHPDGDRYAWVDEKAPLMPWKESLRPKRKSDVWTHREMFFALLDYFDPNPYDNYVKAAMVAQLEGIDPEELIPWLSQSDKYSPGDEKLTEKFGSTAEEIKAEKDSHAYTLYSLYKDVRDEQGGKGAWKCPFSARGLNSMKGMGGSKGGRKPVTTDIANGFIDIHSTGAHAHLKKYRGMWFELLNKGGYAPLDKEDVESKIVSYLRREFPNYATTSMVGNVLMHMASEDVGAVPSRLNMPCMLSTGENLPRTLLLKNGILNIDKALENMLGLCSRSEALKPHSPDYFSTYKLPYPYNPEAKCPNWRKYLETSLKDLENREMLQMMMGLCLIPCTDYEVFFILFGPAGGGKNTALNVLADIVGKHNLCCLPLINFVDKHASYVLTENLVNIVGDMPVRDNTSGISKIEGMLKDVVSGGLVRVEKKYKDATALPAIARCIFATNHLPTFADRSSGIWDRLRIISFPEQIRGTENQDKNLKHKLKLELPGIFNWCLEGLNMLEDRGFFPESRASKAILEEHRIRCDHEMSFVKENLKRGNDFIICSELYRSYKLYCRSLGVPARSKGKFENRLLVLMPYIRKSRSRVDSRRVQVWEGVQYREGCEGINLSAMF